MLGGTTAQKTKNGNKVQLKEEAIMFASNKQCIFKIFEHREEDFREKIFSPKISKPLKYNHTHNIYCTIFPNLTQCTLLYHMVKRRKKASLRPLKAHAI